jgi:hypothetical protein
LTRNSDSPAGFLGRTLSGTRIDKENAMTATTKWIGIGLLALTLGGAAVAADGSDGRDHPRLRQAMARHPRLARALRHRAQAREGIQRLVESLQATDAQRAVALDAARAAEPIARAARSEAARIRAEALAEHGDDRAAARAEMKERLGDLRRRTLADLAPHASRVLATLTPEQRQKLADAATARGRTLDEERLVKLTSFLLTRPASLTRLEAKLGR